MPDVVLSEVARRQLILQLARAQELKFLGSMHVEDQIDHALGFATAYRQHRPDHDPDLFADLGSGGGVPALVVAHVFPSSEVVLVERGTRRATFLAEAVDELGMTGRITVVEAEAEVMGRAEDLRGRAALVTARSFAPPAVTAECAAPMLAAGGLLIVSEPPQEIAGAGARWSTDGLAELAMVVPTNGYVSSAAGSYQVVEQEAVVADRYPRRAGVPRKRPLW